MNIRKLIRELVRDEFKCDSIVRIFIKGATDVLYQIYAYRDDFNTLRIYIREKSLVRGMKDNGELIKDLIFGGSELDVEACFEDYDSRAKYQIDTVSSAVEGFITIYLTPIKNQDEVQ
ncbi:MAG: hypothetical protein F6K61_21480 [Sphaerospermopsis sp. SIO1G1]|nr:hypothetical protein [Sphaerospermopsis sp. SIO1G1]